MVICIHATIITLLTWHFSYTCAVKELYFGQMTFWECYIEVDHFSIDHGLDIHHLDGIFSNSLSVGAVQTCVFDKIFGIFFFQFSDEESTGFPPKYCQWWELTVFLIHEETGILINFTCEHYTDICYAILKCIIHK